MNNIFQDYLQTFGVLNFKKDKTKTNVYERKIIIEKVIVTKSSTALDDVLKAFGTLNSYSSSSDMFGSIFYKDE